jgi:hypothetical protein
MVMTQAPPKPQEKPLPEPNGVPRPYQLKNKFSAGSGASKA